MFRLKGLWTMFAAVAGLGIVLMAAPASAQQGESRTIEVVPAEGAAPSASQKGWGDGGRQSANIGNSQSKGPEQRVALVIGNSAYASATPLGNPTNDAKQVAELMTAAGFEVTSGTDLDHDDMIEIIQTFAGKIAKRGPNTVAFVYYAGHGLQVAGDNFLIPVDAKISREADVEPSSIRLVDIMATLEAVPSRMRIVVLDACRNDPFDALKDDGNGLAIVDAPNGSIVAYSTAPGTQAYDGSGRNSPYTAAFLRLARQPNVPIEQFFKKVRLLVNDTTDGRQTPWESSSLTGDFYFFGETATASYRPAPAKVAYQPRAVRARPPREAYEYVIFEDSIEYYEDYIELYPHDPLLFKIKALLAAKMLSVAWYNTVLQNSPAAYQAFSSKFGNSQYAQAAQKLQLQPKLKPIYQPSNIIVPSQLAPQIKLTSLPQPQPKPLPLIKPDVIKQLDFSKSANANAGGTGNNKDAAQNQQRQNHDQQIELQKNQITTPAPGKSLLDVRLPKRDERETVTPDIKIRPIDGKFGKLHPEDTASNQPEVNTKQPALDTKRPNFTDRRDRDVVGPNVRVETLPDGGRVKIGARVESDGRRPPRFVDLPPRPAPQIQQTTPRLADPSLRFRPGARFADQNANAQQGPRGQLQFRGPVSKPVAPTGRRCAMIDHHPVCR